MFPEPFVLSLNKIGPVTAEILLSKSLGGGWVVMLCKPILVFSLSLGQAEQKPEIMFCYVTLGWGLTISAKCLFCHIPFCSGSVLVLFCSVPVLFPSARVECVPL